MPVKRRASKSRRWRITPEAAARWSEVRPDGLSDNCIDDDALAELVDWPVLVAMPPGELQELRDALEEAIGCQ